MMLDNIKEFYEAYEDFLDKDDETSYNILVSKMSRLNNTFVREILNDGRFGFAGKRVEQPSGDSPSGDVRQTEQEPEQT